MMGNFIWREFGFFWKGFNYFGKGHLVHPVK